MNPKQIRFMVAVSLIAVALYMFQLSRNRGTDRAAVAAAASASAAPPPPSPGVPDPAHPGPRDFYVARQPLEPGYLLRVTREQVELRTIPDSLPIPDGALLVKNFDGFENKILVGSIAQGELLLRSRFGDARTQMQERKLRDVIPGGMRAIAVDLDALSSAAGFIAQGDVVDVMASYTLAGKELTRVVIQNVEILARGYEYRSSNRPTGERTVRGNAGSMTVTLAVAPQMAIKLAHMVDERGFNRFRLVLKNRDDKATYLSRGTRLTEVLSDAPLLAHVGSSTTPGEISVYRGSVETRESTEEVIGGPQPEPVAPPAGGGRTIASTEDLLDRIAPVADRNSAFPPPPAPPPGDVRMDGPPQSRPNG